MSNAHRSWVVVTLVALLIVVAGAGRVVAAQDDANMYQLPINVVNCTQLPPADFEGGGETLAYGPLGAEWCDPGVGASFTVISSDESEVFGSCVADLPAPDALNALCYVPVHYNTEVVVTEDLDSLPAGYAPIANPKMLTTPPESSNEGPGGAAAFINLPQDGEQNQEGESGQEEQGGQEEEPPIVPSTDSDPDSDDTSESSISRPAHIHAGTCDNLAKEPRYDLADLTTPNAEAEGSPDAIVAETSISVIAVSLSDLLASSHALDVRLGRGEDDGVAVCGEIGGPPHEDGSITIGLHGVDDAPIVGIASLMPDAGDPTQTIVIVSVIETD